MPVFTDLKARIEQEADWQTRYEANKDAASEVARRIHLVHVTGDDAGHLEALLVTPPYELPTSATRAEASTKRAESLYDLGSCLYFYAGRACPSFGKAAFAFGADQEHSKTGSATPFDTGGMEKFIHSTLLDLAAKQAYVTASIIPLLQWRRLFTGFLAAYFNPIDAYWNGRPCVDDPEGIFMDPRNEWRRGRLRSGFMKGSASTMPKLGALQRTRCRGFSTTS